MEEGAIMSPRSWNRREFSVSQAGYFTVLKPTRWFSATLPPSTKYLKGPTNDGFPPAPGKTTPIHTANPEAAISFQSVDPGAAGRNPIRLILIVLTAAALTLSVLWWMTPNNPWHDLGR
jgi:hypothetical protein